MTATGDHPADEQRQERRRRDSGRRRRSRRAAGTARRRSSATPARSAPSRKPSRTRYGRTAAPTRRSETGVAGMSSGRSSGREERCPSPSGRRRMAGRSRIDSTVAPRSIRWPAGAAGARELAAVAGSPRIDLRNRLAPARWCSASAPPKPLSSDWSSTRSAASALPSATPRRNAFNSALSTASASRSSSSTPRRSRSSCLSPATLSLASSTSPVGSCCRSSPSNLAR